MLKSHLEYCLDGFNLVQKQIDSMESLVKDLQEAKNKASTIIKGIFAVDILVKDIGRISIGLDEKCILTYTSEDFEKSLTSLGDESAQGETMYYFGDYSLMSNKYIISFTNALTVLEELIYTGALSESIKWTEQLF